MRAAVVGHLEWVQFMKVAALPQAGDIVHAEESWDEPAGGGPVAAEQLLKLGAETAFFTALGRDELGVAAYEDLSDRGLNVQVAWRDAPTRRAVTHVEQGGERTITVLGERLAPSSSDELDWDLLAGCSAVYFTAGNVGALKLARRAEVLTATARALPTLKEAGLDLDAVVGSRVDPSEAFATHDLDPSPRLAVWTEGDRGGRYSRREGSSGRYRSEPPPGPVIDRYGAGDGFAAGLTYGLGRGLSVEDSLRLAARCGAAAVTGRGAYSGQLIGSGSAEEDR